MRAKEYRDTIKRYSEEKRTEMTYPMMMKNIKEGMVPDILIDILDVLERIEAQD